uniref:Uncharacterized protein n=1 Tax=Strongyloides stercoralis TaxID=6248 RepID=A0AAF5CRH4_STRER
MKESILAFVLPSNLNNKYKDNINEFFSINDNDDELENLTGFNINKQLFRNDNSFEKRKFDSTDYESFVPIAKPSWAGIGGIWGKRSYDQNLGYRNNLMLQKLFG